MVDYLDKTDKEDFVNKLEVGNFDIEEAFRLPEVDKELGPLQNKLADLDFEVLAG
eukprot:CAMPEP_0202946056 /NCGR_PEP_ID=MMETSP1395-20130829/8271_1 /ASSEMBLY_ACC=CAM_ASM_000871 /TAXON_ID=5961 /ORGANISM="Blepharisma japonicum, Strain Stock R1072" /LENGTH=54 /DNA_ID=CAMNT_0049646419 /DNA_START=342 /DNA_END=506 /DNA_ORIENTATION=+